MDHLRQDIIKPIYLRSSFDTIRPASSGGGGEVPDDVDDGDHFDECSPFFLSYARAAESPAAVAATTARPPATEPVKHTLATRASPIRREV